MPNPSCMVGQHPGLRAAADLSAKQFYLVKISAAGYVNLAGAGEVALGVLINEPESGDNADVFSSGPVGEVIMDGTSAIAIGDPLKSDASGVAVKAGTDKDHIIGWALEACTAAGDIRKFRPAPGSLSA